jgi:uncharacterized RDD family membrane protein YckC
MSIPPPPPFTSPPPPPPVGYGTDGPTNYASFGARLGAVLIDGLIGAAFMLPGRLLEAGGADALGSLLSLAGFVAFYVLYCRMVSTGQSWGQKVTGVRIVGATTGQSISAGMVFVRQLAKIISSFACLLGFFWMLWDGRKQTWHDKLVSTVVITA